MTQLWTSSRCSLLSPPLFCCCSELHLVKVILILFVSKRIALDLGNHPESLKHTICHYMSIHVFIHFQGANASALEKEIGSEQFPVNEHYFGLVNVCIYDLKHACTSCHLLSCIYFLLPSWQKEIFPFCTY